MSKKVDPVERANAKALADLVADTQTTDYLRVRIITKLLESREGQDFFKSVFEDGLSFGACPDCGHLNHWAIPEDILNQMGWVTHEKDPQVPQVTNEEICPEFQEACAKKKVVV